MCVRASVCVRGRTHAQASCSAPLLTHRISWGTQLHSSTQPHSPPAYPQPSTHRHPQGILAHLPARCPTLVHSLSRRTNVSHSALRSASANSATSAKNKKAARASMCLMAVHVPYFYVPPRGWLKQGTFRDGSLVLRMRKKCCATKLAASTPEWPSQTMNIMPCGCELRFRGCTNSTSYKRGATGSGNDCC